jgi:hypothetical protein
MHCPWAAVRGIYLLALGEFCFEALIIKQGHSLPAAPPN